MSRALVAFGAGCGAIGELIKGLTRGYVRAKNGKLERVSSYTTKRNAAQEAAGQMSLASLMEEPEPAPVAVEEPVSTAPGASVTVSPGETAPVLDLADPETPEEQYRNIIESVMGDSSKVEPQRQMRALAERAKSGEVPDAFRIAALKFDYARETGRLTNEALAFLRNGDGAKFADWLAGWLVGLEHGEGDMYLSLNALAAETPEPKAETIAAEPETIEPETRRAGNPKLTTKLRALADGMEERIQEKLNPGVLNQRTTYRRANMAASSQAEGRNMQTVQTLLRGLADGHEEGTIPPILAGLTTKAQVEQVAMHGDGFPDPLISLSNMSDLLAAAKGLRGVAEVRDRVQHLPDRVIGSNDWRIFLHPDEADSVMALLSLVEKKNPEFKKQYIGTWIRDRISGSRRLATAGIMNAEQFAEARKLLGAMLNPESAEARQKRELQDKERELIGAKIPGYFPTPPAVVDRMLEEAELAPGQKILEPSAGKGNIADAIRDAEPGADLSVVEWSPGLNEILKLKGHNVVGSDFLEHSAPAGGYDRILMNPPFEKRQDVEHVRRAYDLLAPGGRVVAIMSEGPFFGSDRTAEDFRDWLDGSLATAVQLPAGSFYSSENPTGVNTRLVVIDKPAA
jgi:phospholipid N-methyltransferase